MEVTRRVPLPAMLEQTTPLPDNERQAGIDAGDIELKKHAEQAKRFGNEALKNHPQLNHVKGALQTLQPDQLLKLLKSTINTVGGYSARTPLDRQDIPQLKAPAAKGYDGSAKLSASAWATALLGKVMQLTADSSMSTLQSKLQAINATLGGGVNAYSVLADRLEKDGAELLNTVEKLNLAQQKEKELLLGVTQAKSALNEAQNSLSSLEAKAAGEDPVSCALQCRIDAAKTVVAGAQAALTKASGAHNNHITTVVNPAVAAQSNARAALEASQLASAKLVESFSPQQQIAIEGQRKQKDAEAKSLTFLMALMSELINQSSNADLQATAELKQKLAEAATKDAEKKAKEYEEQVRKAEEMQKTMGCIGKIVGWVITVVSVAAAAFTGGASLALAAVGLALAVGDEISQAVSGRSFMADAMQPLMDSVIKPMMEKLGAMFTSILLAAGVDMETAKMVGQILGAIAAAAVLVAGMSIAGDILSKAGSKIMEKLGGNVAKEASKTMGKNVAVEVQKEVAENVTNNVVRTTVKEVAEEVSQEVAEKTTKTIMQRLMDSSVAQLMKRLSKGVGRSFGADEMQVAKVSNYSQQGLLVMTLANTTSQSAVGIISAQMLVEAAKARADMMKDAALQELLNEMMDRAIESFTYRMEAVSEIVKNISAVAENQAQAGHFITKKMSSVAG